MRRSIRPVRGVSLALCLLAIPPCIQAQSLADRFSPELKAIRSQVEKIEDRLRQLPDIPMEDLGGNGAYGRQFGNPQLGWHPPVDFTIRFEWSEPAAIDLLALVPARKFTAAGLDPEYGFPDDFSVSLIRPDNEERQPVGQITASSSSPVHRGHPYVFELDEPVLAEGVELKVTRLRASDATTADYLNFALAEFFCFSGERNVMADAEISFSYDQTSTSSPYWSPIFMIDGNTPLGLPELPATDGEEWPDIGWISHSHVEEDSRVSLTIDLGRREVINGLRMFPARRPSLADFPGFGIPKRFRVETNLPPPPRTFTPAFTFDQKDLVNPGSNPVTVRFPPVEARFVRLQATRLWKAFDHYPAFLSFSEVQVLMNEEILSDGASVRTAELKDPVEAQGKKFWSPTALTDRHGPTGELVSRPEWLRLLNERLSLEGERHALGLRVESITRQWSRSALLLLGILGATGILVAIILPFRYRRLERKRIRTIRDRIAGDLHDDVGSNLGSIQLLSEMARSKPDSHEELTLIGQVAAETVTSVRDIVWLLRPRHGYRASTISHLRDSASILLESIEWTFNSDLEDFALNDEDGRHLVLFFREALHNLVRHAKAGRASIDICRKGTEIHLVIRDDGRGIPPELLDRPETLRALKQRAARLDATLEINSKPGLGTTLHLAFTPKPLSLTKSPRYPFSRHSDPA